MFFDSHFCLETALPAELSWIYFMQCMQLVLNIPQNRGKFDKIKSIDEAADIMGFKSF